MNIELRVPTRPDRVLIRRLMELYLYDFSEFDDSDLDEHGLFSYGDLDYFWFEPTHAAFLVIIDGNLGGFVLVDNEVLLDGSERSLTELFVMRKYRRRGVGRQAACQVFDRLPARWEVQVIDRNTPAQEFWRKVTAVYSGGVFQETRLEKEGWKGIVLSFDNRRWLAKGGAEAG